MSKEIKDEKVQNLFQKFMKLVKDEFGSQKFAEAKLKDGTVIFYEGDMPTEGMEVYVIPSDGSEKLPAPDGVHELEDGTQLEVVGGKIVKVVAVAAMEDTPAASAVPATEAEAVAKRVIESTVKETVYAAVKEATAPFEENIKAVSEAFGTYKAETDKTIEALRAENKTLTEEVAKAKAESKEVKDKFSKFSDETDKLFAEFGAKPQVKPEPKKAEFQTENKNNPAKLSPEEWRKKFMSK